MGLCGNFLPENWGCPQKNFWITQSDLMNACVIASHAETNGHHITLFQSLKSLLLIPLKRFVGEAADSCGNGRPSVYCLCDRRTYQPCRNASNPACAIWTRCQGVLQGVCIDHGRNKRTL